jgi:carboxyl-terminal processing protease
MVRRWIVNKGWIVALPTVLLVVVLGVGGAQQSPTELLAPLTEVYNYVQSYFYWPDRIEDTSLVHGAMKGMVEALGDPYSEFLDPRDLTGWNESLEGEFVGVGIEIAIRDGVLTVVAPLEGTPAEEAGLVSGDQILAIDGESTEGITLTEAAVRIRGQPGTTVVLLLRHKDGTTAETPIVRRQITVPAAKSELKAEGRVAYIRLSRFDKDATTELDRALAGFDLAHLDGMILDLRNNAGGLLEQAIRVASRFVDQGVVVSTKDRVSKEQSYWSTGNTIPNLPLAVLVNGGTASAAEIAAGAIRDHRMGVLAGEKTFGKGVIQRMIEFDDGSALKLTTGEYFTPLGHVVQEVGLEPDLPVAEGEDPLQVAIDWVKAHAGSLMPLPQEQQAP